MDQNQWESTVKDVTNRMMAHTRRFKTPLSTETKTHVKLVGSGTYLKIESCKYLLTCEHVAQTVPLDYQFHGTDDIFRMSNDFTTDKSIDAAIAKLDERCWQAYMHQADAVCYDRFSKRHELALPEEILFFYGWAGENASYGFGTLATKGTGYCSQEIKNSGNEDFFEIFWDPQNTQPSTISKPDASSLIKYDDPSGFSGSIVWNTRYCELTSQGCEWSPEDAIVTGLLQFWNAKKKSLLALRIEHLRELIDKNIVA